VTDVRLQPADASPASHYLVLSLATWIVVLLGLVEKVTNNQTSDLQRMADMNPL
jgi:hypothetical protein